MQRGSPWFSSTAAPSPEGGGAPGGGGSAIRFTDYRCITHQRPQLARATRSTYFDQLRPRRSSSSAAHLCAAAMDENNPAARFKTMALVSPAERCAAILARPIQIVTLSPRRSQVLANKGNTPTVLQTAATNSNARNDPPFIAAFHLALG